MILRILGTGFVLLGFPLLFFFCVPGFLSMGVGLLFIIAGTPRKVVVLPDGTEAKAPQSIPTWSALAFCVAVVGILLLIWQGRSPATDALVQDLRTAVGGWFTVEPPAATTAPSIAATPPSSRTSQTKDNLKSEISESVEPGGPEDEDDSSEPQVVSSSPQTQGENDIETPVDESPAASTQPAQADGIHGPMEVWTTEPDRAAMVAYKLAVQVEKTRIEGAIDAHQRNAAKYGDTEYGRRSARAVIRLKKLAATRPATP